MEIDITHLMERCDEMYLYSASQAEMGSDAGPVTWANALDCFDPELPDPTAPLAPPESIDEVKSFFGDFGAWDQDEIAEWTPQKVNALLLQFIAGDIREVSDVIFDDYDEYQRQSDAGRVSGRIYKCDIEGHESFGRWFYYVGN